MGNATWYPSDFLRYYTVDLAGLLVKGSPVFLFNGYNFINFV